MMSAARLYNIVFAFTKKDICIPELYNIFFAFTEKDICIPELYIFLASTQMLIHLTEFYSIFSGC